ncbi:hypothetical protein ACFW1A_34545 [Kitasatospora sp. NPDC058965]|uniref:hypothetical protein n=1 Tax=Kitasatospora sp. NPDC058965 TaxID=3346682 RepID=UPI003688E21B
MEDHVMLSNRKLGAGLGAVVLGGTLLVAAAPAQAASPTPKTLPTPTSDGAKGICKRVPKLQDRIDKALDRLNGPVTEAGSISRLQQRTDLAKQQGHTEIYTYLNDRLTFRKSLVPTLTTRQSDLKSVATWCTSQGLGGDAK